MTKQLGYYYFFIYDSSILCVYANKYDTRFTKVK